MSEPHILVIEATEEGWVPKVTVECPGLTANCVMWWPCSTCEPSTVDDRDAFIDGGGAEDIHGVTHSLIDGVLMTEIDRCFVAEHERLTDAAIDLGVPPGRYPITWDFGDGTELELSVVAAGGGGEERQ